MVDSYDKMTIDMFYKIKDIMSEGEWGIDTQVRLVAILNNMEENDVLDLPLDRYSELVEGLAFLYEMPKAKKRRRVSSIMLDGERYNLFADVSKMSTGQYIDYQTYLENNLGFEYVLSTLLIPEGKRYGDYEVRAVIDAIREFMDIQTAYDVCFFFRKRLLSSIRDFLICLDLMGNRRMPMEQREKMREMRRMTRQLLSSLNGNGRTLLTR